MDFRSRLKETTVTSIVTYILFVVAVVFADIMYLQLVTRVVDSGLLILAIAGAFALGGSVLILPRKLKNGDIKPGAQRSVAISVLVTEFFIMAANVVVAFAEKSGDIPEGILGIYATYVAPITPVLAALGILLIWLADPIDKAKQTEYQVDTAKKVAELELKGQLSMTAVIAMEEFLQTDEAKQVMQAAAREQGYKLLRDVLQTSGIATGPSAQPVYQPAVPASLSIPAAAPVMTAPMLTPAPSVAPELTEWIPYTAINGNGHGPNH